MKNYAKFVFRAWMHYFEVSNSRKKFHYERTQSTQLDPKQSLGLFRIIFQTFGTKNYGKLVFRAWMHYFGVSNSQKKFRYERTQSTQLDPKRSLGVFRSILQTFGMKNYAKLVFRTWMHYFEVSNW